jgi:hypothetical protein
MIGRQALCLCSNASGLCSFSRRVIARQGATRRAKTLESLASTRMTSVSCAATVTFVDQTDGW